MMTGKNILLCREFCILYSYNKLSIKNPGEGPQGE
jgi:hypothetical protein